LREKKPESLSLFKVHRDIKNINITVHLIVKNSVVILLLCYTESGAADAKNAPEEIVKRKVLPDIGGGTQSDKNEDGG
jgi:hypothetical protein